MSAVTDPSHARAAEQRLPPSGVYGLVEGRLAGVSTSLTSWSDDLLVGSPLLPLSSMRSTYSLCTRALAVTSSRTAVQLLIHANTVRYRLDRLVELTDVDLGETPQHGRSHVLTTLHTWWALRTWMDRSARS